jgi:hypothetical protein
MSAITTYERAPMRLLANVLTNGVATRAETRVLMAAIGEN